MDFVGKLSAVESPNKFFVMNKNRYSNFSELKENLRYHYEKFGPQLVQDEKPMSGSLAIAKFEGYFVRIKISRADWDTNKDKVKAKLIDVGGVAEFEYKKLWRMAKKFDVDEIPANFVIRCHLRDVRAKGWTPYIWPEEAEKFLVKEFVKVRREIEVLIRGQHQIMHDGEQSTPVEIFYTELLADGAFCPLKRVKFSLSQELLRKNLARLVVEEGEHLEESAYCVTSSDSDSESNPVIESPSVHLPLPSSWTNPIIPNEKIFKARGSTVSNLGQIFIQTVDNLKPLRQLRRQLENAFHHSEPEMRTDWKKGDCVVAFDSAENEWVRGIISELNEEKAVVFSVDYGNLMIASLHDLRTPTGFEAQPVLALRVILHDVLPTARVWDRDTIGILFDYVNYQKFEVSVAEDSEEELELPLRVEIRLKNGAGNSLSKELRKLACFREGFIDVKRIKTQLDKEGFGILGSVHSTSLPSFQTLEESSETCTINSWPWCESSFLAPGTYENVQIASIIDLNNVNILLNQTDYTELLKKITRAYEFEPPAVLSLGEPVLARIDRGVYRAIIVEFTTEKVEVNLIDFGLNDYAERTALKSVPPEFLLENPLCSTVALNNNGVNLIQFVERVKRLDGYTLKIIVNKDGKANFYKKEDEKYLNILC